MAYVGIYDKSGRVASDTDALIREGWTFAEAADTEEKYPVPSAFAAYTGYLNIKLGNEKYRRQE